MFSRIRSIRIHDFFFTKFSLFSFKTRQNFSIEIKNVAKNVYFHKTICISLKRKQDIFRESNWWICRFGIRENMSRASYMSALAFSRLVLPVKPNSFARNLAIAIDWEISTPLQLRTGIWPQGVALKVKMLINLINTFDYVWSKILNHS